MSGRIHIDGVLPRRCPDCGFRIGLHVEISVWPGFKDAPAWAVCSRCDFKRELSQEDYETVIDELAVDRETRQLREALRERGIRRF